MIWGRRRDPGDRPEPNKAAEALEETLRDLERTKAQTPVFRALHQAIREVRTTNHIGEHLADIYRGSRS